MKYYRRDCEKIIRLRRQETYCELLSSGYVMAIVIMNAHGCGYHTEIAQKIIHKNRMGANWGKKEGHSKWEIDKREMGEI